MKKENTNLFSVVYYRPVHIREYKLKEYCKEHNIEMNSTIFTRVYKFSCKDEHQLDLLRFKFPLKEYNSK